MPHIGAFDISVFLAAHANIRKYGHVRTNLLELDLYLACAQLRSASEREIAALSKQVLVRLGAHSRVITLENDSDLNSFYLC